MNDFVKKIKRLSFRHIWKSKKDMDWRKSLKVIKKNID